MFNVHDDHYILSSVDVIYSSKHVYMCHVAMHDDIIMIKIVYYIGHQNYT